MFDDRTSHGLLKSLECDTGLSQQDLARRLGISLGKVSHRLNGRIERGGPKVNNFRDSENKLAPAGLPTPLGADEKARITLRLLRRWKTEHEHLREEIEALKLEARRTGLMKETHEHA